MDAKKFGRFLAEMRKQKHMTQAELAAKIDVTDKAVSRWERGVGFPDVTNWEGLASALDISLVELIQGEKKSEEALSISEVDSLLTDALQIKTENSSRLLIKKFIVFCLFAVSVCGLVFLFLKEGLTVIYSVLSLFLGITAWFIPVWILLQKNIRDKYLGPFVSMILAILSLLVQFGQIFSYVTKGDWSALSDTMGVLVVVAVLFSVITVFLNIKIVLGNNTQ